MKFQIAKAHRAVRISKVQRLVRRKQLHDRSTPDVGHAPSAELLLARQKRRTRWQQRVGLNVFFFFTFFSFQCDEKQNLLFSLVLVSQCELDQRMSCSVVAELLIMPCFPHDGNLPVARNSQQWRGPFQ